MNREQLTQQAITAWTRMMRRLGAANPETAARDIVEAQLRQASPEFISAEGILRALINTAESAHES
jgi:hypothetical protein